MPADVLTFDIETVPDVEFGRRLFDLHDLPDAQVAEYMFFRRRQQVGHDFLPLTQQRVVAISVALRSRDGFRVWSLGDEQADERELITRFFDGLDRYTPTLVSWNGSGFDLPVLHYRCLRHGIAAPRYWESGDGDQSFRWNNYLNRYHWRHTDLMDVLSAFQGSGRARLDEVALLMGLPGKMGMDGSRVWDAHQRGELAGIRHYCETDVLNTYLVYLGFQRMTGQLDEQGLAREHAVVENHLRTVDRPHLRAFLDAWKQAPAASES